MKLITTIVLAVAALAATACGASADEGTEPVNIDAPAVFSVLPAHCLINAETAEVKQGKCVVTSYGKRRPTVVVWGDSHATQLEPAIVANARAKRTNLVYFTAGGCPAMITHATDGCSKRAQAAMSFIRHHRKATVVVAAGYAYYTSEKPDSAVARLWAKGVNPMFASLRHMGIRFAVVGQQPFEFGSPNADAMDAALRGVGGHFIDVARLMTAPTFSDAYHLDVSTTAQYAPAFRWVFAR